MLLKPDPAVCYEAEKRDILTVYMNTINKQITDFH